MGAHACANSMRAGLHSCMNPDLGIEVHGGPQLQCVQRVSSPNSDRCKGVAIYQKEEAAKELPFVKKNCPMYFTCKNRKTRTKPQLLAQD